MKRMLITISATAVGGIALISCMGLLAEGIAGVDSAAWRARNDPGLT